MGQQAGRTIPKQVFLDNPTELAVELADILQGIRSGGNAAHYVVGGAALTATGPADRALYPAMRQALVVIQTIRVSDSARLRDFREEYETPVC